MRGNAERRHGHGQYDGIQSNCCALHGVRQHIQGVECRDADKAERRTTEWRCGSGRAGTIVQDRRAPLIAGAPQVRDRLGREHDEKWSQHHHPHHLGYHGSVLRHLR